MDSLALRQGIVREILLVKDSLERHSVAGFICRLPDDVVLVRGSERAFRIVQGEWREFPLQEIPLNHLLAAFKSAIAKRQQITESRIAHLVQSSDRLEELQQAADSLELDTLAKLLAQLEESRRRD